MAKKKTKTKIEIEIEMEFDLKKFKEWFSALPKRKKWTWKDELKDFIDDAVKGLTEDLFLQCNIDEFWWKVRKIKVVR